MKKLIVLLALVLPYPAVADTGQDVCAIITTMVYSEVNVLLKCEYSWVNLGNLGNGNVYGFDILRGSGETVAGLLGFLSGLIVPLDNTVPTKTVGMALQNGTDMFYIRMSDLRRCHRLHGVGSNSWSMCVISAFVTD